MPIQNSFYKRRTIGLFIESVGATYQSVLWPGVADVAREQGFNFITFAGGMLEKSPHDSFEKQRNSIYTFVKKEQIDGLVIAGTIKNFISTPEFENFLTNFKDIPIVTLIPATPDIPGILADNSGGIRDIVSHLVKVHKYSNFTFIGGPEGNIEAEQRLNLVRDELEKNSITIEPSSILPGNFSYAYGYKVTKQFLEKGNFKSDAIIAVNDESALGAITALQEHGLRVPEDVAVTGFDDLEESKSSTPPLTTVRQPLYEMGRTAAEVLIDMLNGKKIPLRIELQAPTIIRQSCGCFANPQKKFCIRSRILSEHQLTNDNRQLFHDRIIEELYSLLFDIQGISGSPLITELVDSFLDEITGCLHGVFLPALNKVARAMVLADADALQWQEALALFRSFTNEVAGTQRDIIENLLHDAYLVLGETAVRVQAHKRVLEAKESALLRTVGQCIANAYDLPQLVTVIANELPKLGIDECYMALYETKYETSRLVLALNNGVRTPLESELIFPSSQIIPDTFKTTDDQFSFIVEPLYFKDESLGYIVLKNGTCKGIVFEALKEHISGALRGALLMKQVQEQAIALEKTNGQLQLLRDQEHEYLEAIRRELELGREIQESFLPRHLPIISGWEISTLFLPAREVSGDFYDAFTLDDGRVVLVIADVSGKDVSAALFMSLIRTLIRALSEQALQGAADPLDAVAMTNRYIINHHQGDGSRYMYATLFIGVLDTTTNVLTYVNAGHNPPAILGANGGVKRWVGPTGPAVGMTIEAEYERLHLTIEPGESLFAYTDGVTDARDADGELFSRQRLTKILIEVSHNADALIDKIESAIVKHNSGVPPFDDITMLAIRKSNIAS